MELSEEEIERYSRHILLKEVGASGQMALKRSRVLVIGAGGLGSPVALYLAAAGVGRIGLVDEDTVDLSNLQRQILHSSATVGMPKVSSAATMIKAINPNVKVETYPVRITPENAGEIIAHYDIICDGSDNFSTRYLLNDACFFAKKPLVSAAVLRFEGQISAFSAYKEGPCYRCLYPYPPPPGQIPSCSEAGILGAVTGVLGTLQATEILKEIMGLGESLRGKVLTWNALSMKFRTLILPKNPSCPLCGETPTINTLMT
ncbi:HesA/MoeB/ThiF family protein [Entomobacter blattae]|uniref:HesA/MoeB/ThiF family protein n=1 Tax=Entomobacter blattae TaxID=2762277 RepID=UPI00193B8BB7|nr:molybdopterin-synthase adenylyltransferase MoeB [Entomobacter blattae]